MTPEEKLAALGLVLPQPAPPVANYVPFAVAGNLLVISGQLPLGPDGALPPGFLGKVGQTVSPETAKEAARMSAINVLTQARAALGNLDRVVRCVRLGGFINCQPNFAALAPIMNGASDLMVEIFGDRGRHARTTIGVAELPLDAAVEVEALFTFE